MLLNKKTERIQALTETVQEQAWQMEQLQVSMAQLPPHICVCQMHVSCTDCTDMLGTWCADTQWCAWNVGMLLHVCMAAL
jgi:hypothetical protein